MAPSCALHDMSQQVMNDSDIEMGMEYGLKVPQLYTKGEIAVVRLNGGRYK